MYSLHLFFASLLGVAYLIVPHYGAILVGVLHWAFSFFAF